MDQRHIFGVTWINFDYLIGSILSNVDIESILEFAGKYLDFIVFSPLRVFQYVSAC